MRTTLTLDPDVAAMLKKAVAKGDATFKDVVNSALRSGLGPAGGPSKPKKRWVQRTWGDRGEVFIKSPEDIKRILQEEDDERFRDLGRR